jgi:predicted acyltransferase
MEPAQAALPAENRVASIDALRGFDMFWLIGGRTVVLALVALAFGAVPPWLDRQLEHPDWEGFTAWDMVMPLFLFVVGVAMPIALGRRIAKGQSKGKIYWRVARRFVILFILGMVAQGNLLQYDWNKLHLFSNTLQAIACGYVIAALLLLNVGWRVQAAFTAVLLVAYWGLMMFVPFGGHAAGTLEPTANLARYVDHHVLGRFNDGTTYTWVLSSLGFGATVMLGVFAGHVLMSRTSPWSKVAALALLGVGCLAAGWMWSYHFPIIKHIWSSSMVLWAGGWSYLLLAAFYLVIDVLGYRRWAFPLVVIGANAIATYMAASLFDFRCVGDIFVGHLAPRLGAAADLVRSATALAVFWLILCYLYRKRTFLRI